VDLELLARGLLIGFAIAAPVGPIGLLCIQRTLVHGRLAGLATGLGAASADALYGMVAGFGLTAVSGFLAQQRLWLGLIGGAFLCYLGVRTWRARPGVQALGEADWGQTFHGRWAAYGSTLLLTLTNPMTIFSFMAVFAGLGLAAAPGGYTRAGLLVLGVFLGSAAWWLLLSSGVGLLRGYLGPGGLRWINRGAGAIILVFGLVMLASLGLGR
jgi:threonine/homoserine/homoserine lactone efflux protein